jgi:hypothetical protein
MEYLFAPVATEARRFVLRECNIGDRNDRIANHVIGTAGNTVVVIERCRIATAVGLFYAASSAPTIQYSSILDNYFDVASGWGLLTTLGMRFSTVSRNRAAASWDIITATVASVYNAIGENFMRGGAITTTGSSGNSAIVGNTQVTVTGVGSDSLAGNT